MIGPSPRLLLVVYLCLVVLWLATYFLATLPLVPAAHFGLALGISTAKMLLIVAFFMHLYYRPALFRLAAGAGVVWVMILFGLAMSDYVARSWIPKVSEAAQVASDSET